MWRRIEVNAWVDHPVERVFAYLANPLLWHEFAPACVYRRQIGNIGVLPDMHPHVPTVNPGEPAARAGLKPGAVIVTVATGRVTT